MKIIIYKGLYITENINGITNGRFIISGSGIGLKNIPE
jgi:hypothetical protein